jgi:hypothetical protein
LEQVGPAPIILSSIRLAKGRNLSFQSRPRQLPTCHACRR